ncbi:hypothetical protein Pmani_002849 [Petrolisthes manimaculis]|uniref:Uncharacterized protein n=1 Tax=Petrolisthes manimaculis TaxID=1843537 RepID=A0AAE1QHJ4_9EUCA|nr:hypothetical protein Pmani_002849 [Petrolisthes manimaculis]
MADKPSVDDLPLCTEVILSDINKVLEYAETYSKRQVEEKINKVKDNQYELRQSYLKAYSDLQGGVCDAQAVLESWHMDLEKNLNCCLKNKEDKIKQQLTDHENQLLKLTSGIIATKVAVAASEKFQSITTPGKNKSVLDKVNDLLTIVNNIDKVDVDGVTAAVKFVANEQTFASFLNQDMPQNLGCVGGSTAPMDLQLVMMVDVDSNEFIYNIIVPKDIEKVEIQDNIKCELLLQGQEETGIPLTPKWNSNYLEIKFTCCMSSPHTLCVYLYNTHINNSPAVYKPKDSVWKHDMMPVAMKNHFQDIRVEDEEELNYITDESVMNNENPNDINIRRCLWPVPSSPPPSETPPESPPIVKMEGMLYEDQSEASTVDPSLWRISRTQKVPALPAPMRRPRMHSESCMENEHGPDYKKIRISVFYSQSDADLVISPEEGKAEVDDGQTLYIEDQMMCCSDSAVAHVYTPGVCKAFTKHLKTPRAGLQTIIEHLYQSLQPVPNSQDGNHTDAEEIDEAELSFTAEYQEKFPGEVGQQQQQQQQQQQLLPTLSQFDKRRAELVFKSSCNRKDPLNRPIGIVQLHSGEILVTDSFNDRLALLGPVGQIINYLTSPQGLHRPSAVVELPTGFIAVKDNNSIVIFDADKNFVRRIKGVLKKPFGLGVTASGCLMTVEGDIPGVLKFVILCPDEDWAIVRKEVHLNLRPEDAQFSKPRFITCFGEEKVLVVDLGLNCVYDVNWKRMCVEAVFGQPGYGEGEFRDPSGIACDKDGNIFVGDSRNHRIQVFNSRKEFECVLKMNVPLQRPSGICLAPENHILVLNYWGNSVAKYRLTS